MVSGHPEVTPVSDGQPSRTNESADGAPAQHDKVIDDLIWWSDFSVTIVPGEFNEFHEIERIRRSAHTERGEHDCLTLLPTIGSTDCHPLSLLETNAFAER